LCVSGSMAYYPAELSPWALTLFRGNYRMMLGYLQGLQV
jgi:hypothetical protein